MLIGVDFGGTQVKAGIVDGGEVVRSVVADTPPGASVGEVLATLTNVVTALSSKPNAVGFAIPGEVDGEGRCWRLTNVPGFEGVHIGRELAERLNCPSRSKMTRPLPRSASDSTAMAARTRASS